MSAVLLVKNSVNSFSRGEVVTILPSEDYLTEGVDKVMYEAKHGEGTWDRRLVTVVVTDRSSDSPDLLRLLEDTEDGSARRKLKIATQGPESPFYEQLLATAKVSIPYSILEVLIYA